MKKGDFSFSPLVIMLLALIIVIIVGAIAIGLVKSPLDLIKTLTDKEKRECVSPNFWCQPPGLKGQCLPWGTIGKEKENCDPNSYKPKGVNDVCTEKCFVEICSKPGEGRTGNRCGICQQAGKECLKNTDCCAPDIYSCGGKSLLSWIPWVSQKGVCQR